VAIHGDPTIAMIFMPFPRFVVPTPGNGSTYSGTVTVKRNGDTFLLAWTIAGSRQIGVGIGKDNFLAVSYRSGDSIGIAFYRADENSGWEGIWAPLGSQTLGTERWTRGP
jgi:hypothetical protein